MTDTWTILEKKERRHVCFYILADVSIIVTDIAALIVLLFILNFYTQPLHQSIATDFLPPAFIDRNSILLIAVFLFLFAAKNILAYYVHQLRYQFLYKIAARIADRNLLQYLEGNYTSYVMVDSAVQIRRISQEPIEFSHYVLAGILQIITQSIMIVIAIVAILIFNAGLFLLLFIILLPPIVLVAYLIKRKTRTARINAQKSSENTLQFLKEALSGYVEANIYGRHDFFKQRYSSWQQKLNAHLSDIQSIQGMPNRMIEIFAVAGLFILIAINQQSANANTDAVINIGAFMAAAYKIMPAAVQILNNSGQVKAYAFTVRDLLPVPADKPVAGIQEQAESIQSISFCNIHFQYASQKILNDFTSCLVKGDFAGIAGKSGRGKTTIVHLLLGFLEPLSGSIRINNKPVNDINRQQYWKQIAYVKQQPFLLHDSIQTNITLNETDYDKDRLKEVIRITGLDELVKASADGINTTITENGKNISGGQAQRIAIARALYKDADLIILDEPFNELDAASEKNLLDHFSELARSGKIVILITHSKESLSRCNKIISLHEN